MICKKIINDILRNMKSIERNLEQTDNRPFICVQLCMYVGTTYDYCNLEYVRTYVMTLFLITVYCSLPTKSMSYVHTLVFDLRVNAIYERICLMQYVGTCCTDR